jgi:uncharacterized membrane protein YcaP (DUF421 family)
MIINDPTWLDVILRVLLLAPLALVWTLAATRVIGLRSFSKMTVFDFVITVAIGSLLANAAVASNWTGWFQSVLSIFVLLLTQAGLTLLRRRFDRVRNLIENEPLLLFSDGEWIEKNLARTRTSKGDIWAKMREANVLTLDEVRAVVLETTGDVSVLHGDTLSDVIMTEVQTDV